MRDSQFATAWIDEIDGQEVQILAYYWISTDDEAGELRHEVNVRTKLGDDTLGYAFGFAEDKRGKAIELIEALADKKDGMRERIRDSFIALLEEQS